MKSLLVCASVFAVLWLAVCFSASHRSSYAQSLQGEAQLPALHGAAALDHLKQTGQFDSLAEAMRQARFAINRASVDDTQVHSQLMIDPVLSLQQKLLAKNGAAGDQLGTSVAISGETVVIGAPGRDIGTALDQGAAFVFVRKGARWEQQDVLTPIIGSANEKLGASVAIDGDTIVVGAPGTVSLPGAAYVFVRSQSVWTQQAKLVADDGRAGDQFGFSVAVSGNTAVVGAPDDDTLTTVIDHGSAYVFVRSGNNWTQQGKLLNVSVEPGNRFGQSVALNGNTAVIGSPGDEVNANNSQGSATVWVRNGATWTVQQVLTASDGAVPDQFGFSVALQNNAVVIGAPGRRELGNFSQGAAYVFNRSGTTWTQQHKLTPSVSEQAAYFLFGASVAPDGASVLIGAPGRSVAGNPAYGQGLAYLYTFNDFTLSLQQSARLIGV